MQKEGLNYSWLEHPQAGLKPLLMGLKNKPLPPSLSSFLFFRLRSHSHDGRRRGGGDNLPQKRPFATHPHVCRRGDARCFPSICAAEKKVVTSKRMFFFLLRFIGESSAPLLLCANHLGAKEAESDNCHHSSPLQRPLERLTVVTPF